tara:strand:- start:806 stop:1312 length:507 start_codon:yes stop_codon:yes gene_type:complete
MSMVNIKDESIVRNHGNNMQNKYCGILQVINVDDLIQDCFISEYLEDNCFGDKDDLTGFDFLVIEAFNSIFVTISYMGDHPSIVFKNYDGVMFTASTSTVSIDYDSGVYYVGDEITEVSKCEPYNTKQSWLWDSLCVDPKIKSFGISEKTMLKLLEVRADDIKAIFNK